MMGPVLSIIYIRLCLELSNHINHIYLFYDHPRSRRTNTSLFWMVRYINEVHGEIVDINEVHDFTD